MFLLEKNVLFLHLGKHLLSPYNHCFRVVFFCTIFGNLGQITIPGLSNGNFLTQSSKLSFGRFNLNSDVILLKRGFLIFLDGGKKLRLLSLNFLEDIILDVFFWLVYDLLHYCLSYLLLVDDHGLFLPKSELFHILLVLLFFREILNIKVVLFAPSALLDVLFAELNRLLLLYALCVVPDVRFFHIFSNELTVF